MEPKPENEEHQEHTEKQETPEKCPAKDPHDQHGEHHEHKHHEHCGHEEHHKHHKELHIFVNRRKFGRSDGVKERMTGGEIATLVGVPPDRAVVRRESGSDKEEIGVDQEVHIKDGEHFLVTRKTVEGGYVA